MAPLNSKRRWEMGEKQILIQFTELDRLEITCGKCGTGIVLSASNLAPELKSNCPGCSAPIHDAATAVSRFREFYAAAEKCGNKMAFRLQIDKEKT